MAKHHLQTAACALSLILSALACAAGPWRPGWGEGAPPVPEGMFDEAGFDGGGAFASRARADSRYLLSFGEPGRGPGAHTLCEISLRVRAGAEGAVWLTLGEGAVKIGNEQGAWLVLAEGDALAMDALWQGGPPGEHAVTVRLFVSGGAVAGVRADRAPAYLSAPQSWKGVSVHARDWQTARLSLRGENSALISAAMRWRTPETLIILR